MSEIMQIRRFEKPIGVDYLHQAMEALGVQSRSIVESV